MDKKKIFLFICFLFIAVVLSSLIKSCLEGEKGKIKRVIFSAARAIERENLIRLSSYVSFGYHDKYGNDRRSLLFLSQRIFYENEDITVQIKELEIEVDNLDAQAQIEAMGMARRATTTQEKNPLEYDIIKFKVYFKKEEDNKWRVIELEYLEPGEIRFFPAA